MKQKIVLLGGGGFAKEILNWSKNCLEFNFDQVIGYLSPEPSGISDIKYLGSDENFNSFKEVKFLLTVGSIPARKAIVEKIKSKGGEFITLTHSTAIIASGSEIGEGCIICPFAMVGPDTRIGDFTIINFYSSVAHDCVVDSHCVLSPYSSINGNSKLGKEVFLGPHSTVSSNITVGSQVKVSSGSAVMKNTPDRNLVYGVPGKYAPIF